MFSVISFSVNAICPLLLMVLLGYQLKKHDFFTQEFLRVANRFVFKLAIPLHLFVSVYNISDPGQVDSVFLAALFASLCALTLLGICLGRFCTTRRDRRAVLIQSALRSNFAAAGLAIANSLAGEAGVALGAVASIIVVIFYNIVAVISLTVYAGTEGTRTTPWQVVKNTLKNPLILGILFGLAALGLRTFIPTGPDGLPVFTLRYSLPWLWEFVESIGGLGLPLALVVMGGNFHFDQIAGMKKELVSGVLARNLISPLLGFAVAMVTANLLGSPLTSTGLAVLIGVFCTPLAVATTVMCAEMGSDAKLAAQIVVWSSIGSLLSSFFAIALLRGLGFL